MWIEVHFCFAQGLFFERETAGNFFPGAQDLSFWCQFTIFSSSPVSYFISHSFFPDVGSKLAYVISIKGLGFITLWGSTLLRATKYVYKFIFIICIRFYVNLYDLKKPSFYPQVRQSIPMIVFQWKRCTKHFKKLKFLIK